MQGPCTLAAPDRVAGSSLSPPAPSSTPPCPPAEARAQRRGAGAGSKAAGRGGAEQMGGGAGRAARAALHHAGRTADGGHQGARLSEVDLHTLTQSPPPQPPPRPCCPPPPPPLLPSLAAQAPDGIAKVSVRNDAAFLMTVVGSTSVAAVALGQLPGEAQRTARGGVGGGVAQGAGHLAALAPAPTPTLAAPLLPPPRRLGVLHLLPLRRHLAGSPGGRQHQPWPAPGLYRPLLPGVPRLSRARGAPRGRPLSGGIPSGRARRRLLAHAGQGACACASPGERASQGCPAALSAVGTIAAR